MIYARVVTNWMEDALHAAERVEEDEKAAG